MKVKQVSEPSFKKYGRIITSVQEVLSLLEVMNEVDVPDGVIYEPSVNALEALPIAQEIQSKLFGELPIQIGYCNGHNHLLNALEYHRNSEINVAVTDMVLLLGSQQDISEDYTYDTSLVEAFYVPAGTVVEMYGTTLHYAPCSVDELGFKCIVILPKHTNLALDDCEREVGEDRLLAAKNKWLIAHKDAGIKGAFVGLLGKNIEVK